MKFKAVPLPSLPFGTLSIVAAVTIGMTEKKNIPNNPIRITSPKPSSKIRNKNKYIAINVIEICITGFLPNLSDKIPIIGVEIIPAAVIRAICQPITQAE